MSPVADLPHGVTKPIQLLRVDFTLAQLGCHLWPKALGWMRCDPPMPSSRTLEGEAAPSTVMFGPSPGSIWLRFPNQLDA